MVRGAGPVPRGRPGPGRPDGFRVVEPDAPGLLRARRRAATGRGSAGRGRARSGASIASGPRPGHAVAVRPARAAGHDRRARPVDRLSRGRPAHPALAPGPAPGHRDPARASGTIARRSSRSITACAITGPATARAGSTGGPRPGSASRWSRNSSSRTSRTWRSCSTPGCRGPRSPPEQREALEQAIQFAATVCLETCRHQGRRLLLGWTGPTPGVRQGPASVKLLHELLEQLAVMRPATEGEPRRPVRRTAAGRPPRGDPDRRLDPADQPARGGRAVGAALRRPRAGSWAASSCSTPRRAT